MTLTAENDIAERGGHQRRLLVVEDDAEILSLLTDVLTTAGYAVEGFRQGRQAMDRLRRQGDPEIHLILLDLMMPGMDGWEFRALQKADPALNAIPVVAISASASPKAAAIDAARFLRKPVGLQELVTAVERVLLDGERKRIRARLDQAERLASLGTLAAGVGHEISNPLSFTIGSLDALVARLDRVRRQVDRLSSGETAPERMSTDLRAINDNLGEMTELLSACQIGTDRIRLVLRTLHSLARRPSKERAPVDPHRVLGGSIAMAGNHIRHRARLVQDLGEVRAVLADESRLEQLFVNLLVNAAQAIPEGNAEAHEIRVATRTEGSFLVVEVSDTGGGIPVHLRERVFEPFFTTKPVGVGAGLGLSVCQTVVAEHGGKLEVESEVGKGSLFRVRLPCLDQAVVTAVSGSTAPLQALAAGRVLIVEDEELAGLTMKRMLEGDHEVLVVQRGSEALDRLRGGEAFDAIVCDLMMPNMTGMQLQAEIARLFPEMLDRMVFVTGGAFSPEADDFLRKLTTEPLIKPFRAEELIAAIERVRARHGAMDNS